MKPFDTFLFCFAILFMLIGIHQAMMNGYANSYWLFMLASGSLLWYQIRKKNQKQEEEKKQDKESKASETASKKRKYKM
jgi:hypothetical protein